MFFEPFEEVLVRRWIAGRSFADAVSAVKELNKKNAGAIINHLGEDVTDREIVARAVKSMVEIIDGIKREKLRADVAVKLTDLGLNIDKGLCRKNYERIVKYAKKKGVFVWMDMEQYEFVDSSIEIYAPMARIGNAGICIQSYLKRSLDDVKGLDKRSVIRIVKGAYTDMEHGFATRKESTGNYVLIMDYVFKNFKRFTIATHDSSLIDIALKMNKTYKRDVTYAMLRGVRNDYAFSLAGHGEKVAIYVPFGEEMTSYAYRRLKETSSLKLIIRSMFGG